VLTALRLPLRFDPARLKADLSLVDPGEWRPHYNERDYGGEWSGVALRSPSGAISDLAARGDSFENTGLFTRCQYIREVLASFHCSLKSVRFLRLSSGSFVREHSDPALGFEDGEVRIHVPVETSPEVEFYSAGERLQLDEGDCYYVNVSLPHRVNNPGLTSRIHLVIDAEVNGWVRELFGRGTAIARAALPVGGFEAFRDVLLRDVELQKTLQAIPEREAFLDAIAAAGRERGFRFAAADVEAQCGGTPNPPAGREWAPVKIRFRGSQAVAEWVWFGTRRFNEPFFEDSVLLAMRNPFGRTFRLEAPLPRAGASPAGLIFHLSRCGSTLTARMLSTVAGATVISEAPPVDTLIQAGDIDGLRALVAALKRGDGPCFLKLDCWHIHSLPLLRAAFPETPWIFLYRDPVEVLASHWRSPGRQALPGAMDPAVLKLTAADILLPREEWCARVLAGFCGAALRFREDAKGMFVNYNRLPDAFFGPIREHFSCRLGPEEAEEARRIARSDAKNPSREFLPPSKEDSAGRPARLRESSAALVQSLYLELEEASSRRLSALS
jgi:mannose-6-phosphate isomerase-like protein (cupin superfamily)